MFERRVVCGAGAGVPGGGVVPGTPSGERVRYAELHAHTAYSFLDGASMPEDLVAEAVHLDLEALAITDHDGLPGVVRFAEAARQAALPTVIGAELGLGSTGRVGPPGPGDAQAALLASSNGSAGSWEPPRGRYDPDGTHLLVLARGPEGYRRLSRAIGTALMASNSKGLAAYDLEDLAAAAGGPTRGEWLVLTGCRKGGVRRALQPGGDGSAPHTWDAGAARRELDRLVALFGRDNVAVEVTHHGRPLDSTRNAVLAELAADAGLPLVATGNVHAARPADQPLADVLAATRARASLEELDGWLPPAAAHLRSGAEMLRLHAAHPHAVTTAADLAEECRFDLRLVAPRLPRMPVPDGHTEATWLRELTAREATKRYGTRAAHPRAWEVIDHELDVICALDFPGYFLIVHEIVQFCADQGILCQGRGSAANSAVCFALGITAVDAVHHRMLFERFLSPGRSGPPDIDIDIESGRREEVIQFVYRRYGRDYAAQVANVISYRPRSAVRDVARALGYDVGQADAWSKGIERWSSLRGERPEPGGATAGADGTAAIPGPVVDLAERMLRLPRHLGIHSGGMVLCDRPVIDVCPVGWATAPGRTVLQWDKDDCADAGLVKFDLLGLGMLTALRLAFEACERLDGPGLLDARGEPAELGLHTLPQDDAAVYDLLCAADTVGVFQVESRAQMATLPRLRPRTFYDLVVEVALIRPGPIQGGSVNPYIARRTGKEPVTYLHPLLKPALEKTLGVPLFQEQLMQIAIDVAGFSPAEADQLRKAMGSKRSAERMEALHQRFLDGTAAHGIDTPTGEAIFDKLRAFADFGFPESHSFSFAYLVYASAWLKVHRPEAFYASLLAAQPMGFYSPQTLVADARRHGVRVLPADVAHSDVHARVVRVDADGVQVADDAGAADAAREPGEPGEPGGSAHHGTDPTGLTRPRADFAVRLGLAPVRGVGAQTAARLVAERTEHGPWADLADLARRVDVSAAQLEALATGGALDSFGRPRREALWAAGVLGGEYGQRHARSPRTRGRGGGARGAAGRARPSASHSARFSPVNPVADAPNVLGPAAGRDGRPPAADLVWYQPPLPGTALGTDAPQLAPMDDVEEAVADVWATGLTIDHFPTRFLRPHLDAEDVLRAADLASVEHGTRVRVAGVVTHRQRPHTARGITFLSLEDETGLVNVVVHATTWARYQHDARRSAALAVRGRIESVDGTVNLVADRLTRLPLTVPASTGRYGPHVPAGPDGSPGGTGGRGTPGGAYVPAGRARQGVTFPTGRVRVQDQMPTPPSRDFR